MVKVLFPIRYVRGDATAPLGNGVRIIAHVCNDVGAWGKGFVLALSQRWSEPAQGFKQWHKEREENDFGLGAVQFVRVGEEIWVANMIAQHGIRPSQGIPPIRYGALDHCLEKVAAKAKELNASVHMPRIGCGLAGGEWDRIEPIVVQRLCEQDIPATVYDLE
jgi:O-acetyl-ADP-ribose deacetylase (regulator of RNase III)